MINRHVRICIYCGVILTFGMLLVGEMNGFENLNPTDILRKAAKGTLAVTENTKTYISEEE